MIGIRRVKGYDGYREGKRFKSLGTKLSTYQKNSNAIFGSLNLKKNN